MGIFIEHFIIWFTLFLSLSFWFSHTNLFIRFMISFYHFQQIKPKFWIFYALQIWLIFNQTNFVFHFICIFATFSVLFIFKFKFITTSWWFWMFLILWCLIDCFELFFTLNNFSSIEMFLLVPVIQNFVFFFIDRLSIRF